MLRQKSMFILKVLTTISAVYLLLQCSLNGKTTSSILKDARKPGVHDVTTFGNLSRRTSRMVFIGGPPYSGTTLMRDLLNLHPIIKCRAPQKRLAFSRLAGLRTQWDITQAKSDSLKEIGLTANEIDVVVKKFILKALVPAKSNKTIEACVEDDSALYSMEYLRELFPRSKFILLVRDGRTLVQSIISGKVKVSGYNASNYEKCFKQWNENVKILYNNCLKAGSSTCTVVHYEKLQRNPRKSLKYVLNFLEVGWKSSILLKLNSVESEDALRKERPEMKADLTQHKKRNQMEKIGLPSDVAENIKLWAPMLQRLGYVTDEN